MQGYPDEAETGRVVFTGERFGGLRASFGAHK